MTIWRLSTEKCGLKETFVKSGRIEFYPNSFVYDYDHFGTDNKDAYAVHRYSASWRPDWKVLNKLTLRWGGASYILRKYKKRREAPLPLGEGESFVWHKRMSDYVAWALVKRVEQK